MGIRTFIYDFTKKLFYKTENHTDVESEIKKDAKYVRNNITSKINNWNSKWGKVTKRIGNSSVNGAVFATTNPSYVVKIQPESERAKEEMLILKKLNGKNTPKMYKVS